jgi:hypothetical protein
MSETNPHRAFRHRKLRIAWSVACGMLCLLLIGFWVRSYWYVDKVLCTFNNDVFVYAGSVPGLFSISILDEESVDPWIVYTQSTKEWRAIGGDRWLEQTWAGFYFANAAIMAPYWFWVLIPAILAAVPWIRHLRRFSLRTLLFGMTVIAALLGTAVWATR